MITKCTSVPGRYAGRRRVLRRAGQTLHGARAVADTGAAYHA